MSPVEVAKATVGSRPSARRPSRRRRARPPASTLHPDVARLVEHIYDESKSELVRRIETPLGSLSQGQIERGADVLRELRFAIARGHQDKIVPLTSQYYTLIPHRLGRWTDSNDVAINTIPKADTEEELLQLMRDVYHVQDDLESEVDRKYKALGAQLAVVDRDDPVFQEVACRILKTQSGHHPFKLRVNRVLSVHLPDERARFEQEGQPVGNLQGLFHGTKNCNMVGILSRGLLIAPKNAPVTGYMFGKGIYFADQSSKSAQYALNYAHNRRPYGYLFLADVALGRVKTEHSALLPRGGPGRLPQRPGLPGSVPAPQRVHHLSDRAMHPALRRRDREGVDPTLEDTSPDLDLGHPNLAREGPSEEEEPLTSRLPPLDRACRGNSLAGALRDQAPALG